MTGQIITMMSWTKMKMLFYFTTICAIALLGLTGCFVRTYLLLEPAMISDNQSARVTSLHLLKIVDRILKNRGYVTSEKLGALGVGTADKLIGCYVKNYAVVFERREVVVIVSIRIGTNIPQIEIKGESTSFDELDEVKNEITRSLRDNFKEIHFEIKTVSEPG